MEIRNNRQVFLIGEFQIIYADIPLHESSLKVLAGLSDSLPDNRVGKGKIVFTNEPQ